MSKKNIIEIGDMIEIYFSDRSWIVGYVLYIPAATGDSWHIEIEKADESRNLVKGQLVYIQAFEMMKQLTVKNQPIMR